jgi:beta-lactamase class D
MISGCADENPVSDIFQAEGVVGTFVAASLSGDVVHSYNESRSIERFAPASTFKIANTLIALDVDEVQSESSTFAWDGEDRGIESWNHDQTLATAFKISCVWCYQEIARGVGTERYELELGKLDYGNRTIGDRVDWFWLDGSLQISAIEQITFLRKLYNYDVPYRREHIDVLKKIMITQHTARHTIYAKTGWAATDPQVAWYVGFVESGEDTWLFAMNMQVDSPEQAALREKISLRSLQALGII